MREERREGTEGGKDWGKGKGREVCGILPPYPLRKLGACGGEGWGGARERKRGRGGTREEQGRGIRERRVEDPHESWQIAAPVLYCWEMPFAVVSRKFYPLDGYALRFFICM